MRNNFSSADIISVHDIHVDEIIPVENTSNRRYKWVKRLSFISIISGVIIVSIAVATGGLIIPIVIGGYLIGNGLMLRIVKV